LAQYGPLGPMALAASRCASFLPEAEQWHQKVRERQFHSEDLECNRKEEAAAKDALVQCWHTTAKQAEADRDAESKRLRETQLDAMQQVHDEHWDSACRAAAYEDEISSLKHLIEEERSAHAHQLEQHLVLIGTIRDESEVRVRTAEQRCEALVAAADARAKEATELADLEKKRAAEEVNSARSREEYHIKEIRRQAEEQVRETEEYCRFRLEQMHESVIRRQRTMEETLQHGYAGTRHWKNDAVLAEARRHTIETQRGREELLSANAADALFREGHPGAQDALLDLEKKLYMRAMERTAARAREYDGDAKVAVAAAASSTSPLARLGSNVITAQM